jgi:hypothetical protein
VSDTYQEADTPPRSAERKLREAGMAELADAVDGSVPGRYARTRSARAYLTTPTSTE